MQMHAAVCRISAQGRGQVREHSPRAIEREDVLAAAARAGVLRKAAA
jgi:hypothetical protein